MMFCGAVLFPYRETTDLRLTKYTFIRFYTNIVSSQEQSDSSLVKIKNSVIQSDVSWILILQHRVKVFIRHTYSMSNELCPGRDRLNMQVMGHFLISHQLLIFYTISTDESLPVLLCFISHSLHWHLLLWHQRLSLNKLKIWEYRDLIPGPSVSLSPLHNTMTVCPFSAH